MMSSPEPRQFPFTGQLPPADASAVIITDDQDRYLLQRRDDKPDIFYPGCLGLFGGALEDGETFEEAAIREVQEELGLRLQAPFNRFTRMQLGFEPFGYDSVDRVFFTTRITNEEIQSIVLSEGAGFLLIEAQPLLTQERVVPYDALALWQHVNI